MPLSIGSIIGAAAGAMGRAAASKKPKTKNQQQVQYEQNLSNWKSNKQVQKASVENPAKASKASKPSTKASKAPKSSTKAAASKKPTRRPSISAPSTRPASGSSRGGSFNYGPKPTPNPNRKQSPVKNNFGVS